MAFSLKFAGNSGIEF